MNENTEITTTHRNPWLRGLYMLLMWMAYHVAGAMLFIIAIIQFVLVLFNGQPNPRLITFARSFGNYYQQIVGFLTFVTEKIPFPFSDWPSES